MCDYVLDFLNGKFKYDFTRNYGAGESDAKNRNLKWLEVIVNNINKKNTKRNIFNAILQELEHIRYQKIF